MAKPDIDDGFTRISNELLEAIIGSPMNGSQLAMVLLVIRGTYGWHKKTSKFNWSAIADSIGTDPRNARRMGALLLENKVLHVTESDEIGLQKDYMQWGAFVPKGMHSSPFKGRQRPSGGTRAPHSMVRMHSSEGVSPPHPTDELKKEKKERNFKDSETPAYVQFKSADQIEREHWDQVARDEAAQFKANNERVRLSRLDDLADPSPKYVPGMLAALKAERSKTARA